MERNPCAVNKQWVTFQNPAWVAPSKLSSYGFLGWALRSSVLLDTAPGATWIKFSLLGPPGLDSGPLERPGQDSGLLGLPVLDYERLDPPGLGS